MMDDGQSGEFTPEEVAAQVEARSAETAKLIAGSPERQRAIAEAVLKNPMMQGFLKKLEGQQAKAMDMGYNTGLSSVINGIRSMQLMGMPPALILEKIEAACVTAMIPQDQIGMDTEDLEARRAQERAEAEGQVQYNADEEAAIREAIRILSESTGYENGQDGEG